jgi:hypothetical protein
MTLQFPPRSVQAGTAGKLSPSTEERSERKKLGSGAEHVKERMQRGMYCRKMDG